MEEHSGRFVLRVPPPLHARLRRLARERGVSLNEYCRNAIEHYADRSADGSQLAGEGGPWVDSAHRVVGDRLEGVALFGSRARGEARDSSDVDLLVVISDELVLSRELYREWDRLGVGRRVNPHFVHLPASVSEAGSVWYETAMDGVILFEHDGSISSFLQAVRRAIADGYLRRRYAHGHPYWVKQTEAARAE